MKQAAKTESCVENAKLYTDNHVQSIFRPRQFRLRLVEANKTEQTFGEINAESG